ncbi:MAG: DinB family protein [Burkholderiales bacterium]|nr:DinB family protein [Phycisphaerae bacterium]
MPHTVNQTPDFTAAWDFIRWADNRMLAAAGTIADPAEYFRDRGISHGSVHKLLHHMMSGQAGWLNAWRGSPDPSLPDTSANACPDLAAIVRAWPGVHRAVGAFIGGLSPDQLSRDVRFLRQGREIVLPLDAAIRHLIDHTAYHRGQLNTLVKLAGGRSVWLSYWVYAMRLHPQAGGVTDADFMFYTPP